MSDGIFVTVDFDGVLGAIRTRGISLRRGVLYPAELRGLLGCTRL